MFGFSDIIDINSAVVDANKTKKAIMVFLHRDGCGYCDKMIFQLEDKDVAKAIKKNFILLDINKDEDDTVIYKDFNGTNQKFLKTIGVEFYPAVIFINWCQGRMIYALQGYRNSKSLITALNYISTKSYKEMTLEDFKDELFFDDEK
jgi:thioredoxin-related protein